MSSFLFSAGSNASFHVSAVPFGGGFSQYKKMFKLPMAGNFRNGNPLFILKIYLNCQKIG
jgi:hypothetical protein